MPKLNSHVNPGRVLIATIGGGAMVALLASAALATNAGASASASASASATASQTANKTVAGATFKLPTGAALVAQCRVLENGVDKDSWKSGSGDKDDMTARPMASATASPMATESPTATASATASAPGSAAASARPSSSPSPVVLRNGESLAALDAACDKTMSKDKDDQRPTATASATASAKARSDEDSNKVDPDDRNGSNGDDRNANDGAKGHSDSHQGRGNSNR